MGERKEEMRKGGESELSGSRRGEGEIEAARRKPAQGPGDSPISRITYHSADTYVCVYILRTGVYRICTVYVYNTMLRILPFLPFSSSALPLPPFTTSPFLFRPLFSHLLSRLSSLDGVEGSLFVFVSPLKLESLSRIPWRQIVCNAYLNTDTRYIPWSGLHTVAARDLKQERLALRSITIFLFYWL